MASNQHPTNKSNATAARWLPPKRHLFRALFTWVAIAGIEHALRDTILTTWLTQQAYAFLQGNLPLERRLDIYPVVVVDISRWRTTNALDAITNVPGLFVRSRFEYTDRMALGALVKRLARLEPAVIGVDIDMSPFTPNEGSDGLPPPHNLQFLDDCKNLTSPGGKAVPVFLGIMRSIHDSPEGWLGTTEHQDLAAAITRFRSRSSHMPYELQIHSNAKSLPSLSKATADAYLAANATKPFTLPPWKRRLIKMKDRKRNAPKNEGEWISSFPVNYYSTLPLLENSRLFGEDILRGSDAQIQELTKRVFGKIVLIGTATRFESFDAVSVPSESDPVPGIYMHACAAATLVAKPLFEFNELTGLALSFAVCIISIVAAHRFKASNLGRHFNSVACELLVLIVISVISLGCALALVHWGSILWLQVTVLWFFLAVEFVFAVLASGKHTG